MLGNMDVYLVIDGFCDYSRYAALDTGSDDENEDEEDEDDDDDEEESDEEDDAPPAGAKHALARPASTLPRHRLTGY